MDELIDLLWRPCVFIAALVHLNTQFFRYLTDRLFQASWRTWHSFSIELVCLIAFCLFVKSQTDSTMLRSVGRQVRQYVAGLLLLLVSDIYEFSPRLTLRLLYDVVESLVFEYPSSPGLEITVEHVWTGIMWLLSCEWKTFSCIENTCSVASITEHIRFLLFHCTRHHLHFNTLQRSLSTFHIPLQQH